MKKHLLTVLFCVFLLSNVFGQHDQYSLYSFTNSRVNPAKINLNNDFEASGVFRLQQATSNSNLTSSFLDIKYPFFKNRKRWSSLGLSFNNDQTGINSIFKSNELSLNYAVSLILARPHIISLGTYIKYANQNVSTEGLYSGSQFVEGLGFNSDLPIGEQITAYNSNYLSTGIGAHWSVIDKRGSKKSNLGLSFFDLNRPNTSFTEDFQLPITIVMEGIYRLKYSRKISYYLEALHSNSSTIKSTILGISADLNLLMYNPQLSGQQLYPFVKYRFTEALVLGFDWKVKDFSIGTSIDIPIGNQVSHRGAFEIALKYSKNRKPKKKIKRRRKKTSRKPYSTNTKAKTSNKTILSNETDTTDVSEEITEKQVNTELNIEEPIILYFNFQFGSAKPVLTEKYVLDNVSSILKNDRSMSISITGHTDNVGTIRFNQELSFERAQSIFDLLETMGVDPYQMTLNAKGEKEPISSNKTEEGRSLNRRVVIKFVEN